MDAELAALCPECKIELTIHCAAPFCHWVKCHPCGLVWSEKNYFQYEKQKES